MPPTSKPELIRILCHSRGTGTLTKFEKSTSHHVFQKDCKRLRSCKSPQKNAGKNCISRFSCSFEVFSFELSQSDTTRYIWNLAMYWKQCSYCPWI